MADAPAPTGDGASGSVGDCPAQATSVADRTTETTAERGLTYMRPSSGSLVRDGT
ncbi:hypothetical protein ACGFX2_05435 [Streptomyces goshikiensis]|uniref:hypothetical protein n=1 Tax=Streptomyces goshikiensis TaxID=1942 RepID=UPI003724A406